MIDIHSHILPNVDDGARTIEESINMIKEAYKAGFTTIVSTSHYFLRNYEIEEEERSNYIEEIKEKIKIIMPEMKICIGSEIFVTREMVNLIKSKKASSLNNTKYVLFELPFHNQIQNLQEIIYDLLSNKYIPIIAHPERYEYVQNNPNLLIDLIELGVLFQSNYGSIIGLYGKKAQKTVIKLLENNFIHFLGSDAHRPKIVYERIQKIIENLNEIISEEKIEELTNTNPKLVLENKNIDVDMPKKIKKGLFGY